MDFAQVFKAFNAVFRRRGLGGGGNRGIWKFNFQYPIFNFQCSSGRRQLRADAHLLLDPGGGHWRERVGVLGRAAHSLAGFGTAWSILGREWGACLGGLGCLDGAIRGAVEKGMSGGGRRAETRDSRPETRDKRKQAGWALFRLRAMRPGPRREHGLRSSRACRGISVPMQTAGRGSEAEMFRLRRGAPLLNMTGVCVQLHMRTGRERLCSRVSSRV